MAKTKLHRRGKLTITASAVMLITTLPANAFLGYLLTLNCPTGNNIRQCGLDKGLENASLSVMFIAAWVGVSIILLTIGLIEYFSAKQR